MYKAVVTRRDGIRTELRATIINVGQTDDLVMVTGDNGVVLYSVPLDNFDEVIVVTEVPRLNES